MTLVSVVLSLLQADSAHMHAVRHGMTVVSQQKHLSNCSCATLLIAVLTQAF